MQNKEMCQIYACRKVSLSEENPGFQYYYRVSAPK